MSTSLTGFTVLTIILYKGLTRNLEIRNNIAWALPSFWRLRKVNDTKFGTDDSNGILLNSAKCQDYSFSLFLSYPLLFKRNRLRETQQGAGAKSPPLPLTQIRVKGSALNSIIWNLALCYFVAVSIVRVTPFL